MQAEREREREKFIDKQIDDSRSVSTTPLQGVCVRERERVSERERERERSCIDNQEVEAQLNLALWGHMASRQVSDKCPGKSSGMRRRL